MPLPQVPAPPGYATGLDVPTRWADDDVYGHVNNVQHYAFMDTVVNTWLVREGGLDTRAGEVIGLCVESSCRYHAALAFPETVRCGLRVGDLRTRAVRYEVGLFSEGAVDREDPRPAAEATFVHVFVDRTSRRPVAIPQPIRSALERLVLPG